ncbi:MAG: hypothetical protein ACPGN6_06390 [Gammaproteobacteria bacterium]
MQSYERNGKRLKPPNEHIFKRTKKQPPKYIFHLPNYVPYSNGIASLWYTAYLFSKNQEKPVYIHAYYANEIETYDPPEEYKPLIQTNFEANTDDIVFYCDMEKGNPFKANNVVRYFMAKDYILDGQPAEWNKNDYLLAYSKAVDMVLPQHMTLLPELANLKKYKRQKTSTLLIYYGKCRIALDQTEIKDICKDFDEVKIITRTYPSLRTVLYEELAKAELLVSFDPLTSLNYEANLVGTPVLLIDDVFRDAFDDFNHKLPGFFYDYRELENIDLKKLGDDAFRVAHEDLAYRVSQEDLVTVNTIKNIEDWFANHRENDRSYQVRCIDFYEHHWKQSPIVNCTSFNSVLGYTVARKSQAILIMGFMLLRILTRVKRLKSRIYTAIVSRVFAPARLGTLRYKKSKSHRNVFDTDKIFQMAAHPPPLSAIAIQAAKLVEADQRDAAIRREELERGKLATATSTSDVQTAAPVRSEVQEVDTSQINDIIVVGNDITSRLWKLLCT